MNPVSKKVILILILALIAVGGFWLFRGGYFEKEITPPPVIQEDPTLLGLFEGRIPCEDCERTKVALFLHKDIESQSPTTYTLIRVDVGIESIKRGNDDRVITTEGTWTILRGPATNPNAVIYQLDENSPLEFNSYWAVDDNILLILDENKDPKVGNASWNYTLSRTR